MTFSALPDCLSARVSGTLQQIECEVLLVESAKSLAAAVRDERCEVGLPAVLRYFGRRASAIHRALQSIKGLYPERFAASLATVTDFTRALDQAGSTALPVPAALPIDSVLVRLREMVSGHLAMLPAPLGFNAAPIKARQPGLWRQHRTGADWPIVVLDPCGLPGQSP